MKIGVINFSGNVGKTTISRHLLSPRMNNAPIISIESINSNGSDEVALRGEEFGAIQDQLQTTDDLVVDIGASNVEDFLKAMKKYKGAHEDFDYFVVPVVPAVKQQRDTVNTIETLAGLGIAADKIRVVFNQFEDGKSLENVFSALFGYHSDTNSFTLRPKAVVNTNEIYLLLSNSASTSISGILSNPRDFKAELKVSTDRDERTQLARMIGLRRLADGVNDDLNIVFQELFS